LPAAGDHQDAGNAADAGNRRNDGAGNHGNGGGEYVVQPHTRIAGLAMEDLSSLEGRLRSLGDDLQARAPSGHSHPAGSDRTSASTIANHCCCCYQS
jgi:hypothetical protein